MDDGGDGSRHCCQARFVSLLPHFQERDCSRLLLAALLANRYYWWIDPIGALVLAVYTIVEWSKAVLENAGSLIGKAAPPELIRKLTLITISHHEAIRRIDTVRAYTFGSLYFVEVDIELPEQMHLREAHDIGEDLQNKIEDLPEVERAYVHLDFESRHRPEHTRQRGKATGLMDS